MFERLNAELPLDARDDITFEFIQHRFTKPAKRVIENYPMTKLELDEEKRRYKWGNMESENTFIKKKKKRI